MSTNLIEFQSIDTVDQSNLVQYNWPGSPDEETWRHVIDASLIDSDEHFQTMLFAAKKKNSFILRGSLVPSNSSAQTLHLTIPVYNYSIDVAEETRGLWMKSDATYYKIDTLSSEYSKYFGDVLNTVFKFLELYNALFSCNPKITSKGFHALDHTILSIRKNFGVEIDLEFILNNKQLVENNLTAFLAKKTSSKLYRSIETLTASQVQRSNFYESKSDALLLNSVDDEEEVIAVKLKRKRAIHANKKEQNDDSNSVALSTSENSTSTINRKKINTSSSPHKSLSTDTSLPTISMFLDSAPVDRESPQTDSGDVQKAKFYVQNELFANSPSSSAAESAADSIHYGYNATIEDCSQENNEEKRSIDSIVQSDTSHKYHRSNNPTSSSSSQLESIVKSKPIPKKSSILDAISSSEPTPNAQRVSSNLPKNAAVGGQHSLTFKSNGLPESSSSSQRTIPHQCGIDGSTTLSAYISTATSKSLPASTSLRNDDGRISYPKAARVDYENRSAAVGKDASRADCLMTSVRNRAVSSKDNIHLTAHSPRAALPNFTINRKPVPSFDASTYGESQVADEYNESQRGRNPYPPKKIFTDSRPSRVDGLKLEPPRNSFTNPLSSLASSPSSISGLGRGREAVQPAWMDKSKRKQEDMPTLSRPNKYSGAVAVPSPRSGNKNQIAPKVAIAELFDDKSNENYSAASQRPHSDENSSSSINDLKRRRDALAESEGPLRPSSELSGSTKAFVDPRIAARSVATREYLKSSNARSHDTDAAKVSSKLRNPICCTFCKSVKPGCKCRESRKQAWLPLTQSSWRTIAAAAGNEKWHVSPFLSSSKALINVFDDLVPSIALIDLVPQPERRVVINNRSSSSGGGGGGLISSVSSGISSFTAFTTVGKRPNKLRRDEGDVRPKDTDDLPQLLLGPEFESAMANKMLNSVIPKMPSPLKTAPKLKKVEWRHKFEDIREFYAWDPSTLLYEMD